MMLGSSPAARTPAPFVQRLGSPILSRKTRVRFPHGVLLKDCYSPKHQGSVAQWLERRIVNPPVVGSIPTRPSTVLFPVRTDPKSKGELSEGMVLAALLRAGKVVLQPFGDNQRYDLVIDENGVFVRIQCKTGKLSSDGSFLIFSTCSSQNHREMGKQDYRGQIELFGVYSPELDKVYFVPVDQVGLRSACLRIKPTANKQNKGVRLASDFSSFPDSSVGRAGGC